ncbi:MAG: MBL fold metallo-hydrolase [Desulfobacteraceae bacterium]|nr:MBL fold metallo-hydrolase [Desulfobacteraceae bacterium]
MKFRIPRMLMLLFAFSCLQVSSVEGGDLPRDEEASSHGHEATSHQVIEKMDLPDYVFRQYDLGALSHFSYLIGSGGKAIIVDPDRDIQRYLKDAQKLGLKIVHVYLTHSHADFVAGHTELKKATGADIIVNKDSGAQFEHTPVTDNSEFRFGNVRAVIRTTPGHTPDGTCLYVYYPANSPEPMMVLTGDTLFIGSVGRPDLLEGSYTSAQLTSMLYDAWRDKLAKVPDDTKIFPAHGAGSLCGAHLSDEPVSTFGEQKKSNPYLQHKDRSSFVMTVISGLREPPQYFSHNAAMNRAGPPPIDWAKQMPPPLTPEDVNNMVKKGDWIIDVRDSRQFAAGHIPGAINISVRGRFETWVGIMVPWGTPIILVGPDAEIREADFRLHRIGYDEPKGYLKGGMAAWKHAGLPEQPVTLVSPPSLYKQMQAGTAPIVVDVRLPKEWMALRIGDVLNMPLDELFREAKRLDPEMPVLMVCNSAYRSSMAAGIMQKLGFKDVRNLDGGGQAWIDAGLPTYGSTASQKVSTPGVYINLPERMSPEDLAKRLMDLPGTIDVVDIRPAWQFSEFHIPGSVNVKVQELLTNPAYRNDQRPLIIVCRDGYISAAVGGSLVQLSKRPVRFLSGGVTRYYDEIMPPKGIMSDGRNPVTPDTPTSSRKKSVVRPPASEKSLVVPSKPAAKRRRPSAGC